VAAISAAAAQAWLSADAWLGNLPVPVFLPVRTQSSTRAWMRWAASMQASWPRQPGVRAGRVGDPQGTAPPVAGLEQGRGRVALLEACPGLNGRYIADLTSIA
jgi:hypothetical protein